MARPTSTPSSSPPSDRPGIPASDPLSSRIVPLTLSKPPPSSIMKRRRSLPDALEDPSSPIDAPLKRNRVLPSDDTPLNGFRTFQRVLGASVFSHRLADIHEEETLQLSPLLESQSSPALNEQQQEAELKEDADSHSIVQKITDKVLKAGCIYNDVPSMDTSSSPPPNESLFTSPLISAPALASPDLKVESLDTPESEILHLPPSRSTLRAREESDGDAELVKESEIEDDELRNEAERELQQLESFYQQLMDKLFALKESELDTLQDAIRQGLDPVYLTDAQVIEENRKTQLQVAERKFNMEQDSIQEEYEAELRQQHRSHFRQRAALRQLFQSQWRSIRVQLHREISMYDRCELQWWSGVDGMRTHGPVQIVPLPNPQINFARERSRVQQFENLHVLASYAEQWDRFERMGPPRLVPFGLFDNEIQSDLEKIESSKVLL